MFAPPVHAPFAPSPHTPFFFGEGGDWGRGLGAGIPSPQNPTLDYGPQNPPLDCRGQLSVAEPSNISMRRPST